MLQELDKIFITVILFVVVYVLKTLILARVTAREVYPAELRRRIVVNVRNGALIFTIVGLAFIWADELRTFALSLVVIVGAVVIATKELILCLSGGLYRTISGQCKVGDRIEVSGMRGDVIDQTLMSTTIMEIGPGQLTHQHTGRAIVLPNAIFLNNSVIDETFTEEYVAHAFQVPLKAEEDWKRAEEVLLRASWAEVSEYIEEAKRHMLGMTRRHALDTPNLDPRVIVRIPEAGKILLIIRIPTPARRKGRIEQAIIRRFLDEYYGKPAEGTPDVPPPG